MIVKVQKPLFSNDRDPPWLIYGKHHHCETYVPASKIPRRVKLALQTQLKAYFEATWEDEQWTLHKQVRTQEW